MLLVSLIYEGRVALVMQIMCSLVSQQVRSGNIVTELTCEVCQTLDSPGCASGFMSVERMKLLLTTGSAINLDQRQQITPDTKWIIGADRGSGDDDTLYPELQIWRSNGNNVYRNKYNINSQ